ncbi:hypothetical protein [uncultured Paracoccus sp.]|uniref:hypothetical protein n=1 Tax=uncultured Paracoccus sp. TaxID=189685 RepID=UPI0026091AA6|nr:hypothetical protein [uncultured Paracoccus sp.]
MSIGAFSGEDGGHEFTNIRVTHVNLPLDAPFWWTGGLYPASPGRYRRLSLH